MRITRHPLAITLLLAFLFLSYSRLLAQPLNTVDSLIKENSFEPAIKVCNSYINAAPSTPNVDLGNIYMRKGRCFLELDRLDSSLSAYFSALRIFESINNFRRAAAANNNIADIYHRNADFPKSKKYYDAAFKYYLKLNDSALLDRNSNDRSIVLFKLGETNEAISIQHHALQQFADVMSEVMKVRHLMNLGTFYENKNADSSLYFYLLSEKHALNTSDTVLLATLYNNIGTIYKNKADWQNASIYLQKSADLADLFENKEAEIKIYHNLATVYDTIGLHQKANYYFRKVIQLAEEVYNIETGYFASELAEKYESGKKDERIKSQETENRLKSRNLLLSLVGLALAVLLALFIYFNYRRKQKANSELKIRNAHIETLNQDLDAANQVKSKIYALISHDIRAPLSTLENYLELNKHTASDQNVNAIRQIDNVLDTLEDLLIWGKSQLHGFTPIASNVDIAKLMEEQLNTLFFSTIQIKDLHLHKNFRAPLLAKIDNNILGIIIRNILSNAFKFAPKGSIVEITGTLNPGAIEISVTNRTSQHLTESLPPKTDSITSSNSGLGHLLIHDFCQKINAQFQYHSKDGSATATLSVSHS